MARLMLGTLSISPLGISFKFCCLFLHVTQEYIKNYYVYQGSKGSRVMHLCVCVCYVEPVLPRMPAWLEPMNLACLVRGVRVSKP